VTRGDQVRGGERLTRFASIDDDFHGRIMLFLRFEPQLALEHEAVFSSAGHDHNLVSHPTFDTFDASMELRGILTHFVLKKTLLLRLARKKMRELVIIKVTAGLSKVLWLLT
jgi:hypothetical protein